VHLVGEARVGERLRRFEQRLQAPVVGVEARERRARGLAEREERRERQAPDPEQRPQRGDRRRAGREVRKREALHHPGERGERHDAAQEVDQEGDPIDALGEDREAVARGLHPGVHRQDGSGG
jgi:hypothetical protein